MSDEPTRVPWSPGTVIRLLHTRANRLWCALPVTVLADTVEATVIRISAGTTWLAAVDDTGARVHLDAEDWMLATTRWTGDDCTYVVRPGRWCAVGWFAPADGAAPGRFYVNGQRPPSYGADELLTLDLELDAELSPTEHRARWKDRDLLQRARDAGSISADEEEHMTIDMAAALGSLPEGPDGILLREHASRRVQPAHLPEAALRAGVGRP